MIFNLASLLKRPDSEITTSSSSTPKQRVPGSFFNNAKDTQISGGSFVNHEAPVVNNGGSIGNYVIYRIQTINKGILFLLFLLLCGALQLASTHLHQLNEGQQKVLSLILEPITRVTREQPKTLNDRVAVNAILNDGGRADDPKCYPGTREEIIRDIEQWIDTSHNHNRMLWLSGPAGGGKTAIMKTIVERSEARGVRTINFFFFRADSTRNGPRSFVGTLLYQIVQHYPATYDTVASILAADPLLLDTNIRTQFSKLVYPLFHIIRKFSTNGIPTVLLIDGLDECDVNVDATSAQGAILRALGSLVSQTDSPFIALVASRREPQIEMGFNRLRLNSSQIFLDDQYRPADDIRHFVTEKFNLIRQTHPKAQQLPENWPSNSDVDGIVVKSSGQFIYAATVMRVLESPFTVPTLSLERLQGIHTSTGKISPFAELDAVYSHILRQTGDWVATRDILSIQLLNNNVLQSPNFNSIHHQRIMVLGVEVYIGHTNEDDFTAEDASDPFIVYIPPAKDLLAAYDPKYTDTMVESAMSYLTPLARFEKWNLVFYHASLSEFLRDPSRSGSFYIDLEGFTKRILPALWSFELTIGMAPAGLNMPSPNRFVGWQLLHRIQQTTPAITQAILTGYTPEWSMSMSTRCRVMFNRLLADISRLYYPHDIKSYKQILRKWCIWADSQNYARGPLVVGVPFLQTYLLLAKIERGLALANWSTLGTRMHIVYPPTGVPFLDTFLSILAMIEHLTRMIFAHIEDPWTKIGISIFIMAVTTTTWIVMWSEKRMQRRLSNPSDSSLA